MKRLIIICSHSLLFIIITIIMWVVAINNVDNIAHTEHSRETSLVQTRIDETIDLLESLVTDEYILSTEHTYGEKATYLTNLNKGENLGYLMIRILDEEIRVYVEGSETPVSSLATRDYMQTLYTTGETQVTDGFLAGANGTIKNYTIAMAIKENNKVIGCIFAAIYCSEIDSYLLDKDCQNVLIGSRLQYMGGVSDAEYGKSLQQAVEVEMASTRTLESITKDFEEKRSGSFWNIGLNTQYLVYTPINHTNWTTLTIVNVYPIISVTLYIYFALIIIFTTSCLVLLHLDKKGYLVKIKK